MVVEGQGGRAVWSRGLGARESKTMSAYGFFVWVSISGEERWRAASVDALGLGVCFSLG